MKPLLFLLAITASALAQVEIESLPEMGLQPQVCTTPSGTVHLVYLKGDPKACDICYTTRGISGGAWATPINVNSAPLSAIATGTIRGAQLALGKDSSVHVIWNGHADAKSKERSQSPLLYARLQPGGKMFSPQQNLMGETTSLDGGASIAANDQGQVSVVWHAANASHPEEAKRLVWVRNSTDDGLIFSAAVPFNPGQPGVCACCSLRAYLSEDNTLSVLYRAVLSTDERPMMAITQKAGQRTSKMLDLWRIAMCPMSSSSLIPSGSYLRAAWENSGAIMTGLLNEPATSWQKLGGKSAKHPVMAENSQGQTLIVAISGSGWGKAGSLHWDLLDAQGQLKESGTGPSVPIWSYAAVYARRDGAFVILQ